MNKQKGVITRDHETGKISKIKGGIEWLATFLPSDEDRQEVRWGATVNPIAGCKHGCRWEMPDGTIAECYAETSAEGTASASYPEGFEHHYWHPQRLEEFSKHREPIKIFANSMSDMFGHWVPSDQIAKSLDAMEPASQHTFILLTKNPKRMMEYEFPDNVWAGFSSPPDYFMGKKLTDIQKYRMFDKAIECMEKIDAKVKWCSFEPLSWDVGQTFFNHVSVLTWAVIGAASRGRDYFQPGKYHVENLLTALDFHKVPVFFKGNLNWKPWRMDFPK